MSTEIKAALEKVNENISDFRKTYDERLAAAEKGNEGRAKELDEQLSKIEKSLDAATEARKEAEKEYEKDRARIERLEERASRLGKGASDVDVAKDAHRVAFEKCIRTRFSDNAALNEMKEARENLAKLDAKQAVIGTPGSGGHGVPEEISRNIQDLMLRFSDVLPEVKMVDVGSSDYKELISINTAAAAWVGETGSRGETATAELRQIAPTFGELYAYPWASEWALQDVFFDVEDWLTVTAAEQFQKALEVAIWSGDGSDKLTGIINTAPAATTDSASPMRAAAAVEYLPTNTNSPQSINMDDVYDLAYQLNAGYRPNAKFYANQNTQRELRKLKDGDSNYLWEPSNQVGQPDRLLGYTVRTWHDMADPTTADGFYLGFGDLRKAYSLPARVGQRITVDDNITKPGFVKYYIRRRFGGIVANNDAFKLLKLADT